MLLLLLLLLLLYAEVLYEVLAVVSFVVIAVAPLLLVPWVARRQRW